jgi:alkanesulfonate monooxygenase SsuD/methylene tetrahydromethanopterin reductase-like flavin-dependent oxidoreductase (luciferase family)
MVPLSILDLSPIVEGGDAANSFRNSADLARHAERLGYRRYWLAEHHNMPGIASAATAVVIGHVAAATSIQGGSTSASAVRPAPTSSRHTPCGAISPAAPTLFPRT